MPKRVYTCRAKVNYVHDADTLGLTLDLGFLIQLTGHTCRLLGVNAPELRTDAGKAALTWATSWVAVHTPPDTEWPFTFESHGLDKYGRWLGVLTAVDDSHALNDDLVTFGQAIPYWP
jgi:endonuclease YncB( thermonuclease family)